MRSLCPRPAPRVKWARAGSRRRAPLAVLAGALALACGQGAEQPDKTPKEVYDVPPPIEIPIADDPQEAPRPKGLSGRLPSGFPTELPLYLPASLIDYGLEADERWVDILTAAGRDQVEPHMLGAAAEAGWKSDGQSDGRSLRLGERSVRLEFRDGNPGTIIRVFF